MNKKRNRLILVGLLIAGVIIGVVTLNLDKIMNAILEFRNGLMGVPRRR